MTILHIVATPHGVATVEAEPDGGYIVAAWTASGSLAVGQAFPKGQTRSAARKFYKLAQALR